MAISFREFPWYIQALLFVALAVIVIGAGIYIPISPVATARANVTQLHDQDTQLKQEVQSLEVYERQYVEFNQEMTALHKQLDTLQAIVPEDKQVDEFMRLLQGAASASGVEIRRLSADAIIPHDYHFEMPFEIQVDGPYYAIEDFFARLSRLSRIINVGDLSFGAVDPARGPGFTARPGTSVTGTCTITTFFSKPSDEPAAAPAAGAAPAAAPSGPLPARSQGKGD
ncbi:MAG: type 4a pilus biogenesis protein PilO [Candidatus Acidiferrales bacterium]|jgi:type IV pilus assembly protein PilO